ncbi:MAG TPA: tRNA (adenosine(37)-N6)-threonylcarbamoyltransferase complex ATPase subunit type 1 TsaE [Burkholderiales bacterium]|nr:tRNA (adenosine(37)-N6)-threonylcarbamoyltransferase complex ATPase subunit type 1 TsaE [Burkholderiales bacterium]
MHTAHHNQTPAPWTRFLADEAATLAIGGALGRALAPGLRVYLRGNLGAGKTTLVRGMLRGLGYVEKVKSPTYTLVELYKLSSLYLYHFDFYRFAHSAEWEDAGFREYFSDASVCVVEWPENAGDLLPAPDMIVTLQSEQEGRCIEVAAKTENGRKCLERMTQDID